MFLSLANSHFSALENGLALVKCRNFYSVQNPTNPESVSYISRPSVRALNSEYSGQRARGIFYQQGQFSDDALVVLDQQLFRLNKEGFLLPLCQLPGTDICQFASTVFGTFVVSGGGLYFIKPDLTCLKIETPDAEPVSSISSLSNYLLLSIKDSNKFYWIRPGEQTVDPLSFASAEASSDWIVKLQAISDELWILGKTSSEVWAPSGDSDAPFIRISGRVYNSGCLTSAAVSHTVINGNSSLVWVTDTYEVKMTQGLPITISNEYITDSLKKSQQFVAYCLRQNKKDFLILTTEFDSFVFDFQAQSWVVWNTYLYPYWAANLGVQILDQIYTVNVIGSSGVISVLETNSVDNTTEWIVSEISALFTFTERLVSNSCNQVRVVGNSGFSPSYEEGALVEVRWSDDQGVNWSTYLQNDFGVRGSTLFETSFRSLGLIKKPGRWFEFRFSNNKPIRLDYITMD
jgi:hypothetical protein